MFSWDMRVSDCLQNKIVVIPGPRLNSPYCTRYIKYDLIKLHVMLVLFFIRTYINILYIGRLCIGLEDSFTLLLESS